MAITSVFDYEEEEEGSQFGLPRSGQYGQGSNVLQLSVNNLFHSIAYRKAARSIRCLAGRVVVEMLPGIRAFSALGVPETVGDNCRPDIGVVLQSTRRGEEPIPPEPGTVVAVRPYDGTWIENADLGDSYRTDGQIRIYGAYKEYDRPEFSDWWDSVICGITMGNGKVKLSHPYVDKIVLKLDPLQTTEGGLMLHDLSQFRNGLATVVAAGSKTDVKPGKRCSYDVDMLLQTGLGLDLVDDRDYSICTEHAINYVIS